MSWVEGHIEVQNSSIEWLRQLFKGIDGQLSLNTYPLFSNRTNMGRLTEVSRAVLPALGSLQ